MFQFKYVFLNFNSLKINASSPTHREKYENIIKKLKKKVDFCQRVGTSYPEIESASEFMKKQICTCVDREESVKSE